MGDVAELVSEAVGGADGLVDVAVGVAVYPVVDSAGVDQHSCQCGGVQAKGLRYLDMDVGGFYNTLT